MGCAIPRRIGRHVHPAARPEAAPEPKASGIDYLGLVAVWRRRNHCASGYAAMAGESRAAEVDQPALFGTGDGGRA